MTSRLSGSSFVAMVDHGARNLLKNKKMLNDLNVFPVPDGDTGTNMSMTLRYGLDNLQTREGTVGELAEKIASLAVFGARGNSGVILSQFFKGIALGLQDYDEADTRTLCAALQSGVKHAYASVAKPVEGTMLTVAREATKAVADALPIDTPVRLMEIFVEEARCSLARTPELLPVLKKASVVDSGGAGIVCLFEGFLTYLQGGEVTLDEPEEKPAEALDLSMINKDTPFPYGYCMEGLLQLKIATKDFDVDDFRDDLARFGGSVVATLEQDKVKLHIHAKKPGSVLDYCQRFGEFLSIKIENMTVQNLQKKKTETKKFLVRDEQGESFSIVAAASNAYLQRLFSDMGADVVILSELTPSSQDFLDAFAMLATKEVVVFPNSANSILAAVQAGGLCKGKTIHVINSRSAADCYGALSVMDFESEVDDVVDASSAAINAAYKAFCYHSVKDIRFGDVAVRKNDFFSLEGGQKILCVDETLDKVVLRTVKRTVEKKNSSLVTIFYADGIAEEYVNYLCERIDGLGLDVELAAVCTMESAYSLALSFE